VTLFADCKSNDHQGGLSSALMVLVKTV